MTRPESPLVRLLRFLGKVQFTTALLLGGVVIMIAGTLVESSESRDAAWSVIYGTAWFDVFLLLIGVNLIVAVVNRIPIQRHQWPFVVTHFSIVILLAGAWISRSYGYEGRMVIFEGEEVNELLLDSSEIRARWSGSASADPDAAEAAFPIAQNVDLGNRVLQAEAAGRPGIRITVHVADGFATRLLGKGGADDPTGIEFHVSGRGVDADDWLIVDDPAYHYKDFGPVEMVFHATGPVVEGESGFPSEHRASIQLLVSPKAGEPPVRIPLPARIDMEVPCGAGLVAVVREFFLRAQVVEGRLSEAPSGKLNPAVVVEISSADATETHTVFANFPDFGTVEGRRFGLPLVSGVALDVSALSAKPVIAVLMTPDGRLHAQVSTAMGVGVAVPVAVGGPVRLAPLDLSFEVKRLVARARPELAVQSSPANRDGGRSFVRIAASFEGEAESFWLPRDGSHTWTLSGGQALELTFGSQIRSVPFAVALDEFELIPHPGSNRPAEYRSHVRVTSAEPEAATEAAVISMNRPLDAGGFRLFQSSYQLGRDGAADATVLSVSYDPGVPTVYTAFVLLVIGIAWGLRIPHHRAAHARLHPEPAAGRTVALGLVALARARRVDRAVGLRLMIVVAAFLFVVLSLATVVRAQPAASASALPLEETRGWAILADGRVKPLQTFAKETALALTGKETVDGARPLEILWGFVFAAEEFGGRPYIRIDSLELRAKLDLKTTQRRFSFDALAGNPTLRELVERATQRQRDGFELDRLEDDALAVYRKLERAAGLISSESLTLVPNAAGDGTWSSPASFAQSGDASRQAIHAGFGELARAYRAGDAVAFRREARALTGALQNVGGAGYPSTSAIDRELFYADFNAFGKAWKLYLVGALVILILGFGERTLGYRTGLLLIGSGFACHSIGIGIRWVIAGRAPVSDMYESLVFMGWGAVVLGLAFEIWQRRRILAASAALLGFLCVAFAENLPIDSNINPLVPVLAHTSWLAVHVMTIMLAYSAFGLAMLVGHAVLFVEVFREDRIPLLGWLSKVLYKTIQIGVLFLAAGIVFGAIWANESWGRYWGWDPKETWSLITFFVYLAIIHARFAGWLRSFGLAASAVLGFLAVIMTYYGVNFLLTTGMHAYGFSEGGQFYVAVYALAECAIVVAAQMMRTTAPGRNGPTHSGTLDHGRVST